MRHMIKCKSNLRISLAVIVLLFAGNAVKAQDVLLGLLGEETPKT